MYMHVDINGAYAAFECAMDPKLSKKPLIIASNNDSSVIAMNKLAKSVGIKRGTPIFKCRDLIQQHRIEVRSSNFTCMKTTQIASMKRWKASRLNRVDIA